MWEGLAGNTFSDTSACGECGTSGNVVIEERIGDEVHGDAWARLLHTRANSSIQG